MKRKSKLPRNERKSVIKAKQQLADFLLPKPVHMLTTTELRKHKSAESTAELQKRKVFACR